MFPERALAHRATTRRSPHSQRSINLTQTTGLKGVGYFPKETLGVVRNGEWILGGQRYSKYPLQSLEGEQWKALETSAQHIIVHKIPSFPRN